jgi:hypothetical protein
MLYEVTATSGDASALLQAVKIPDNRVPYRPAVSGNAFVGEGARHEGRAMAER